MKSIVYNLLIVTALGEFLSVWAGVDDAAITDAEAATLLNIGDRVMRGKDWSYQDEDGGPGSEGTITAFEKEGFATVKWDNGEHKMYRIGADDLYELKIAPNSTRTDTTTTDSFFEFKTNEMTPEEIEALDEVENIITSDEDDRNVFNTNGSTTYQDFTDSGDGDNSTRINAGNGLKSKKNYLIIIACLYLYIFITL